MKNSLKYFLVSAAIIFSATLNAVDTVQSPVRLQISSSDLSKVTELTARILEQSHYSQHHLDKEISAKLFDEYFKTLDPNKIYFSQEDIKGFERYKNRLDKDLLSGKSDFAFEVYNAFIKRLEEYQAFANKTLAKGFDFTQDENFVINRSKLEWPANYAELQELWRKKLKNEVLTLRLVEKAAKEEKEKNPDKAPPVQPWSTKTPEEKVKKRTAQLVEYFKNNNTLDILEIYLSSLARIYDPHSSYMSPRIEEEFNMNMRLSLEGIGALLSSDEGYTKIEKIITGGPAEKDGRLKENDRVIAVAQEGAEPVDIVDMPISEVVKLIRGPKNTNVNLTILEAAKGVNAIPKVITIKRDTVLLKDQEAQGKIKTIKTPAGKELKIGIITLPSFYMDFDEAMKGNADYKSSSRDVKAILEKFNQEKIDGLILDIRSNGGGSLIEAIKLTGLFIKSGPVVQVKARPEDIDVKYDTDDNIYYKGPMIVLINRLSASASEIFAGAIQDYKRGLLVGDTHTHGKGTVQTVLNLQQYYPLMDAKTPSGSLKLTNAQFYRISGASTQLKGVTPDIVFPAFTDYMELGEENLEHALPWDEIRPVQHEDYTKITPATISTLKKQTETRQHSNPKFNLLKKDIEIFDSIRKNKTVSLNETARWDEYKKEKKLHDEQAKLMKLDDDAEGAAPKKSKKGKKDDDDLYMDETCNIMNDYIPLLDKAVKTAGR